jgi:hypothetical protein
MARGPGAGIGKVKIPGASLSIPKRPSVAGIAREPYNPEHSRSVGHTAPRIKPMKSAMRDYGKAPAAAPNQGPSAYIPGMNPNGF